jgi:large repetitive protein
MQWARTTLALALTAFSAACAGEVFTLAAASKDAGSTSAEGGPSDAVAPDSALPVEILARDTFTRTVMSGFGAAEVGGVWGLSGSADMFAVTGGSGTINVSSGVSRSARLGGDVSTDDVDMQVVFAFDKMPTGGGLYASLEARRVDNLTCYRAVIIARTDGSLIVSFSRQQSGDTLTADVPTPVVVSARDFIKARVQVTGTSPTHLRLKVWNATGSEPAPWLLDTIDSTPALQAKGTIGLDFYLSGTATSPVLVSVDNLLVRPASRLP